jgi:hypothetical protein
MKNCCTLILLVLIMCILSVCCTGGAMAENELPYPTLPPPVSGERHTIHIPVVMHLWTMSDSAGIAP